MVHRRLESLQEELERRRQTVRARSAWRAWVRARLPGAEVRVSSLRRMPGRQTQSRIWAWNVEGDGTAAVLIGLDESYMFRRAYVVPREDGGPKRYVVVPDARYARGKALRYRLDTIDELEQALEAMREGRWRGTAG